MKKLLILLLTITLVLSAAAVRSEAVFQKYSCNYLDVFDTVTTVIGYSQSRETFERITGEAHEMLLYLHSLYDNYHVYPDVVNICTLNRTASQEPVTVPQELFDIILWCKETQPSLGNTVNIAMGAVLSIWHEYREAGIADEANAALPSIEALQTASVHCNMDDVILDAENRTVFYNDPLLTLDLGAVAKGYAADLVAKYMLSSDMPSFVVSLGGSTIRTGEPPMDGRLRWGVSVADPDGAIYSADGGDILETLFFSGLSIGTSGDYQRYYTVNGVRYSHIISPDTLMPAAFIRAVTVVAQDAAYADILSTALFLMSPEDGFAMVNLLPGVEALWVLNDRTVLMSSGMKDMAKSMGASSK